MSAGIKFTGADWERIRRDYTLWWQGELERPLIYLALREEEAAQVPRVKRFLANYPPEVPAQQICEEFDRFLQTARYLADAFPHWFINFGAGILAGFIGGNVEPRPDTTWFNPARLRDIEDIRPRFDPDSFWWKRVVDVTRSACQYWEGQVAISHTDLGGTLDVVASLRSTQGLLADLINAPGEVERVIRETSEIWRYCYDCLTDIISPYCPGTVPWAPSWSASRTYMLQCDFSYMVSPDMFERFVLPELQTCCNFLDDAFYHLDGVGALPHLDMLLGIESLKGIQWVPGAGKPAPHDWLNVLGRIRAAGKLCQVHVSPQGALRITRELGGKGFQFVIGDKMTAKDAQAFLQEVAKVNQTSRKA